MTEKYSYTKASQIISARFKDSRSKVPPRTLKHWASKGIDLMPPPKGSGKNRFFNSLDIREGIAIRALQVEYMQSLEDIYKLRLLVKKQLNSSSLYHNLEKLVSAFEISNFVFKGTIERFKLGELLIVKDDRFKIPYRLVDKNVFQGSFLKEKDRVLRKLDFIKFDWAKHPDYFKFEDIEEYLRIFRSNLSPSSIKEKAEKIKKLVKEGVMLKPSERYKGKDYFDSLYLWIGEIWINFMDHYGLEISALKQLKKRIEDNLEEYFFMPEDTFADAKIFYEYEKQNFLFWEFSNWFSSYLGHCEKCIKGHSKEKSISLLNEYIDGFYFIAYAWTSRAAFEDHQEYSFVNTNYVWHVHNAGIFCLKQTPIEKLTPQQIKQGLKQGRFTKKEVEKVFKAKASEVEALRKIIS